MHRFVRGIAFKPLRSLSLQQPHQLQSQLQSQFQPQCLSNLMLRSFGTQRVLFEWKYNPESQQHYKNLLQISEGVNYFELFDLNKSQFDIDEGVLKSKFLTLQRHTHPDKFSRHSNVEKSNSERTSSIVNHAYKILLNPLSRAVYILELNNIQIEEGEGIENQEMLMEIMDIQEKLEESNNKQELKELKDNNLEKISNILQDLSKDFKNNDMKKAKDDTILLRYWTNLQSAIEHHTFGREIRVEH